MSSRNCEMKKMLSEKGSLGTNTVRVPIRIVTLGLYILFSCAGKKQQAIQCQAHLDVFQYAVKGGQAYHPPFCTSATNRVRCDTP